MLITGALAALMLLMLAILAPVLTTYDYKMQDIPSRLMQPDSRHIFGTDELGRDVFSRMLYGARVSMTVGIIAVLISTVIGVMLGSVAGFFGGWIDNVIMRFVDIMLTIPVLFLILMLIVFLGPSIMNVMIIIGLTSWTDIARLIRAEVMSVKKLAYVDAARLIGLPDRDIILKHILPNILGPVFVYMTFGISGAILTESGLSFLGLGVQPPDPSWGNILTAGKDYISTAWWMVLYPGLAIFAAVFSYNILGEGLRDYFNPRLKRENK
jgi:peptide/nickel transport system permease protein